MSRFNMTPGNYSDPTPDPDEAVRQLNSLLRGEISACETYRMAIDKVSHSDPVPMDNVSILREIQSQHDRAAQELRQRITQLGGKPSDSSGAWGAWAQTVQGAMNLFGDTSALKSLKEGEEHGLKDYKQALDDLDSDSQQLIASQLIPRQEHHLSLINQLMTVTGGS